MSFPFDVNINRHPVEHQNRDKLNEIEEKLKIRNEPDICSSAPCTGEIRIVENVYLSVGLRVPARQLDGWKVPNERGECKKKISTNASVV